MHYKYLLTILLSSVAVGRPVDQAASETDISTNNLAAAAPQDRPHDRPHNNRDRPHGGPGPAYGPGPHPHGGGPAVIVEGPPPPVIYMRSNPGAICPRDRVVWDNVLRANVCTI